MIYLDGGAWVRGNIDVRGTRNVRIIGPGVLSGDLWSGENVGSSALPFAEFTNYAMITGDFAGNGASVNGITIVDSPGYNFFGGATHVYSPFGLEEQRLWPQMDELLGYPTESQPYRIGKLHHDTDAQRGEGLEKERLACIQIAHSDANVIKQGSLLGHRRYKRKPRSCRKPRPEAPPTWSSWRHDALATVFVFQFQ